MSESIHSLIEQVRLELGPHPDQLLGFCKRNARVLAQKLQSQRPDATVEIVRGGLDYDDEPAAPDTFQEAQKLGLVHYWVLVTTQERTIHCDVATEAPNCWPIGSEPTCGKKPDCYVEFDRLHPDDL